MRRNAERKRHFSRHSKDIYIYIYICLLHQSNGGGHVCVSRALGALFCWAGCARFSSTRPNEPHLCRAQCAKIRSPLDACLGRLLPTRRLLGMPAPLGAFLGCLLMVPIFFVFFLAGFCWWSDSVLLEHGQLAGADIDSTGAACKTEILQRRWRQSRNF